MKLKHLFTSILLVLACQYSLGQDYYFGLRAGYSQSQLEGDGAPALALQDRQGFTFAFVHNVRFNRSKFGFTIETGYVLKGARINSATNDYRFHYLNAPVLLDFYPTEKLKLSVGPEVAFLADARNRTSDSTSVGINDVFNERWEVSGTASVSYALDFFADIGVRYSRGFTKTQNLDAILNRRNQYNSYFQVFIMLKLAN